MRYMSGKAKMTVAGMVIGLTAATLITGLAMKGQLGFLGMAVVLLVAVLAGAAGWLIGVQMRVKADRDRAFLEGYKQGRERGELVSSQRRFTTILVGGWGR